MIKENKHSLYLDFLCSEFPNFTRDQLNLIYRYFDLIYFVHESKKWISSWEISQGVERNIETIYIRLRELRDNGIFECTEGRSKYYKSKLSDDDIKKFDKLTKCHCCGKRVSFQGGYLDVNICRKQKTKIRCKKSCQ